MRLHTGILRAALAAAFSVYALSANAHFVWVSVDRTGGKIVAQIAFGESTEPDDAELLAKVTPVELTRRATDSPATNRTEKLKHELRKDADGNGSLVSALADDKPGVLEAKLRYGVVARGGAPFLLEYYAKCLDLVPSEDWTKVAASKAFPLDVVPALAGGKLTVNVTWQGKPTAECELVLLDSAGDVHKAKSDAKGAASFDKLPPGRVAVRAKYAEMESRGKHDGEDYSSVRHYSTLTLMMPK